MVTDALRGRIAVHHVAAQYTTLQHSAPRCNTVADGSGEKRPTVRGLRAQRTHGARTHSAPNSSPMKIAKTGAGGSARGGPFSARKKAVRLVAAKR